MPESKMSRGEMIRRLDGLVADQHELAKEVNALLSEMRRRLDIVRDDSLAICRRTDWLLPIVAESLQAEIDQQTADIIGASPKKNARLRAAGEVATLGPSEDGA
jgi:hypothetical protein